METCEFCGEEKEFEFICGGTPFHGGYCEDCVKLSMAEDKLALQSIRDKKKAAHNK